MLLINKQNKLFLPVKYGFLSLSCVSCGRRSTTAMHELSNRCVVSHHKFLACIVQRTLRSEKRHRRFSYESDLSGIYILRFDCREETS